MRPRRNRASRFDGVLVPLVYTVTALATGLTLPRLEHRWLPDWVNTMSPAAAMNVSSAIASGMVALTSIVFSLTFVMVQFSATAYSPRLVLWVARDPVVGHSLGVFIATFLYALAMLSWIDRDSSGTVPLISGWMVLALLLASMGLFVALIARMRMLQVSQMLIFTGNEGRRSIAETYSAATVGTTVLTAPDLRGLEPSQTLVHLASPQVIQALDHEALVGLASRAGAVIVMAAAVGETLVGSAPVLRVYGARESLDESALRDAVVIGDERTFEQDPKYALRLVIDIAIKALSPAINDPTTAVQALDQIEDLLLRLGQYQLEVGVFPDAAGQARLVVPVPDWDDLLLLALDEIRAYGADSVQVMRRMNALVRNLAVRLPAHRLASVRHWERRLQGSINRSFEDADEKRDASVADRQGLGIAEGNPTASAAIDTSGSHQVTPTPAPS